MKRALVYIVSVAFLLSALAFAADKPATDTTKVDPAKTNVVKSAKMHATGKVIEISDSSIKIERTVKDNAETMEFVLDKPTENVLFGSRNFRPAESAGAHYADSFGSHSRCGCNSILHRAAKIYSALKLSGNIFSNQISI